MSGVPIPEPSLTVAAYTPDSADGYTILNLIAWCVTAGGVFGLLVVGMQMSLQLRRGDPGEGGEHFRGVFFVALACVIAVTAGPLVEFLGDLSLHAPSSSK
ncbi:MULTISPECIES: hypothetical protein [Streptomyces]|uniref:Integral membrane protein n=1 Tax=Streptomyces lienomycini TaxID=284035 RepID=A0ABV9X7R9_9ACTN|nr:hypothetical protein [Streptomyces sp. NBC_00334]